MRRARRAMRRAAAWSRGRADRRGGRRSGRAGRPVRCRDRAARRRRSRTAARRPRRTRPAPAGRCPPRAVRTCRPLGSRETYGPSSAAVRRRSESASRSLSPRPTGGIGDELGEAAEAGIGVHCDGSQLQVACEQVGDQECACRLADAAAGTDQRDDVCARHSRLGEQLPLELRLVLLGPGDQQPLATPAQAGKGAPARRSPIDERCRSSVRHRSLRRVPANSRSGRPVPIRSSLSSHSRFTSRAMRGTVARSPSRSAAIDHSDSPGRTMWNRSF